MSKRRTSKAKYLNVQDATDDKIKKKDPLSVTSSDTVMQIDTSVESHSGYDVRICGHSTPVRKQTYMNDTEDSPEIDYRCSPILIPLTQEANEVAWDWHSSTSKSDKKDTCRSNNTDTPKRTKLLQKKRTSNSPLLYKPHKRNAKLENIESIGKFAAELQAITAQMKSIKRSDEKFSNEPVDCKNDINNSLYSKCKVQDSIEMKASISSKDESNLDICPISKMSTSFEELLNDGINESMIRCSQEIEEKFNTDDPKRNCVSVLSSVREAAELLIQTDRDKYCVIAGNSSSDNSKTSCASESSFTFNRVNNSKTYSRASPGTKLNSASLNTKFKKDGGRNTCFNNNVHNGSSSLLKSSGAEPLIPDDSFDDCLATFMDSDAVLSKSAEHNNICSELGGNLTFGETNCKNTSSSLSAKIIASSAVSKPFAFSQQSKVNDYQNNTKTDQQSNKASTYPGNNTGNGLSRKNILKTEESSVGLREHRKFFKTKSLSDSYFNPGQTTNVNNKVNVKASSDHMSSTNSYSQSMKWGNTNASMNNPRVSAQFPQGVSASEDKKLSPLDGTHNACTLDFNRSTGEGDGSQITRHHSLSSLNTDMKDQSRGIQRRLCTPAEIERKRLEAKMRLEAKRKQQMCAKSATLTGSFIKRPIKR